MMNTSHVPLPIPMDDRLLDLALELKAAGLPWEPAVGCFTWDHQGKIASPSPFPKRIYFILSMKRFLSIFGDVEEMKRCLVWLPTWYQARQIIQRMQTHEVDRGSEGENSQPSSPEAELSGLYRIILKRLKASGKFAAVNRDASGNGDRTEWVRSVIASEVGDVSRLPKPLQDRIASIYDEVARAYVGWRRIQENQAQDWLPLETAFDENLLGDLGHFYSDYQRSIQSLDRIRKAVLQLSQIDERKDRDTYDRLIALILGNDDPQLTERAILDRLTNGDTV